MPQEILAPSVRYMDGAREVDHVEVRPLNNNSFRPGPLYNFNVSRAGDSDYDNGMLVPFVQQPMVMIIALSVAYSLVFLLAVVNNSLVLSVIYRTPQMRNVTNYFLANLAIADLTVSFIVLPITLLSNIFTGRSILNPQVYSMIS